MKKVIKLLFLLVILTPLIISADTYNNEVKNANDLINREFYVNTYEKYIVQGKKIKYEFSNNVIKYNSQFKKGGFISKDEFELTKVNNLSYLLTETGYWTLSKDKKNIYAITKKNIDEPKDVNSDYGARVTEYIKPKTVVSGSGTQNDPWQFDPMYKVSVSVNTEYATIVSGNNEYVKGNCTTDECSANIKITGKSGYRYISNDCNGKYDIKTKLLTIKNVRKNLDCNVEFAYGLFTISVSDAIPETFYAIYADNYYSDLDKKTVLKSITSIPTKKGYKFVGVMYEDLLIIDKNKKLNKDALNDITKDLTVEPKYEANKYTLTYDCNGGKNPPKAQSIQYNKDFSLTNQVCKKEGYVQTGWNMRADGNGIFWTKKERTDWTWNIDENVTLYAVWKKCPAGTYSGIDDNICSNCRIGTYSSSGSKTCTKCPDGYTSDIASGGKSSCYIKVEAGKYINAIASKTPVECPNGQYKEEHKVKYGEMSYCTSCPKGYEDGTKLSDKTSQDKCLRNVVAGNYIANQNDSGNTICETGYYKEAHKVRYGETSKCEICPIGYRDGNKISDKTSQDKCLRNVTAGYYIASSKSINNTLCPNGQYSTTHSIKYGETSKCNACPKGYEDGRKLDNKVSKESCLKSVPAGNYVADEKSEKTKVCANGFFKEAHQLTYGKTSKCNICPEGYRDGVTVSNKTSKNMCLRNVSGGYYIAKANDTKITLCQDGYYREKHVVTYGGTSICSQCPEGYRDGKNATSKAGIEYCTRIVESGYYVAKANDKVNTMCSNGSYKGTHSVTYGKTSSCNTCPDGYRDGTSIENKTAENKCVRSIPAGYYIMGNKATNNTECPTGYYKAAHNVTYGSVSRCTVCPSGYRNGTKVGNKQSINTCIRNVPQNYYVANSKDDRNTSCPSGTSSSAHTVKYGETSSCK